MLEENIIWIASIDIGKVNFSFYIEEFDLKLLRSIKNIAKAKRFLTNGACTPDFNKILQYVFKNGTKVLLKNIDLTKGTDKKKYLDRDIFYNMNDLLDEYKEYWDKVDIFIVEKQMAFGKKINTMALKLGQHCQSYFMYRYGRFKKVFEFPAYHKTQILGCEKIEKKTKSGKISYKAIEKGDRKKWNIEMCSSILIERDDFDTLSEITSMKKKDDVSDVICQLQAFKYLYFVDDMKEF
jgi:hypothetical protein